MKKVMVILCAICLTANFVMAQNNGKAKKKNYDYGWNYNDGGGGKKVVGEGSVVKEDRNVKDFSGMVSGISADIFVKQSSTFKVTVEGQKNVLALLKTEVENGRLKISFEKGYSISSKEKLNVYIEAPSFVYLGMSGSGNVKAENALSGKELEISISGSGDFELGDIKYDNVNFGISGSGDVLASGKTEWVTFRISGSGDIKAGKLMAQKATCYVSGSGDITCNAKESLEAQVSGSGDIKYAGKPASLKSRVSGSGDIKSLD